MLHLLTYLFGRYNLLQVLSSAKLRCHASRAIAAWRQFRLPSVDTSLVAWSKQLWRGRPFLRLPPQS